jgi:hypothetical protein
MTGNMKKLTSEKYAKELVEKYEEFTLTTHDAILCALVCVNENLKVIPMYKDKYNPINLNPVYTFYKEVKQELETLWEKQLK